MHLSSFTRTLVLVALIFVAALAAAVPPFISFQGRLTTSSGATVANGSYPATIRLFNTPAGGTQLWSEEDTLVTDQGLFSLLLGKNSPLVPSLFDGSVKYLEIQPEGQGTMFPRTPLVSIQYSMRSETALRADTASFANLALTTQRTRDLYHQILDVNPNSTTSVPIITHQFTQKVSLYLYGSPYQGTTAGHTHSGNNSHGHTLVGTVASASVVHGHGFSGNTADGGGEHAHSGSTSVVDLGHGHSFSIGDHNLSHRHDGPYGGHNHEFTADGVPGTGNYLTLANQTDVLSSSNTGDRTCLQAVKREYLVYDLTAPIGHSASIGASLGGHSHSFTTTNTGIWHNHSFSGTTGNNDVAHSHSFSGTASPSGDGLVGTGILPTALPTVVRVYVDGSLAAGPFGGAFSSGELDLTSFFSGIGEHTVEIREEGGTGGRITYNLYVE